ncbi:Retrovirus-related Pol polyprotein from transposon TNT 1-94 [Gossypium australe]|uniref:Retrovirus-related Pol polyprotein from transposon TNT 1-94 n=1 Tax=Gossypium australe TaxID=47621 RepID=A0A5B6X3S4_9ROSI|nr:Retrovirus-related Pol polyprotein from transposon TNT 1-94 [Gossypium australe]
MEGYENNPISSCIFIKRFGSGFVIIVVYILVTIECLNKEFEVKDLRKKRFCLRLQIEHLKNGILVHQTTYIEKVLRIFYMHNTHPLSTPMVVRSLYVNKDPFRP